MKKSLLGNAKGKNLILLISSCGFFTIQLAMAILFFTGIVGYFGEPVSVIGSIELLLSIFNIAVGNIFATLLKLMLGVFYIVATVIILKNAISSISCFINAAFSKEDKSVQDRDDSFLLLIDYIGSTLRMCFTFMMLSIMTSVDFTINDSGIAVLVMGIIAYLASCGIMIYLKNYKLDTIIYRAVAVVVMLVSYVLLVTKLQTASFEELVYGLQLIFGGYLGAISAEVVFSAIASVAVPILYIILQLSITSYVTDVWGYEFYRTSTDGSSASSKFMGMAIAVATVNLVVSMVLESVKAMEISQVFSMIGNELPLLIASIAMFITYRIDDVCEYASSPVATEPSAPVETVVKPAPEQVAVVEESAVTEVKEEPTPAPVEIVEQPVPEQVEVKEEPTPAPVEVAEPAPAPAQVDDVTKLKQFKDLLDSGVITQEEYDAKKKQILGL